MDTQTIVSQVCEKVFELKDTPGIEIEMRVGKFNGQFFDTNVGENAFNKILCGLEQYEGWEEKKVENTEVFYYTTAGVRLSWNEDEDTQKCIKKEKLSHCDFNQFVKSPYDLRFAFAKEIECERPDDDADRVIEKYRRSFIRKNLSIDMTIIKGDIQDVDDESNVKYQVELEIIDPSKIQDEPELFNIIQKVSDVLKILEK